MAVPDGWRAQARRHVAATLTLLAFALLCALQLWALWRAPETWFPAAIEVRLAPGQGIVLGRAELAAPQADSAHLALRRDVDGRWLVRRISTIRQLLVQGGGTDIHAGSAALPAPGQTHFQIDAKLFAISSARAGEISFTRGSSTWRFDGATLYRDGHAQPACPDSALSARMLAWWNRAVPIPLTVARAASFGGNLYCGNRIGLADVAPGAAMLNRVGGQIQLSAGSPDGAAAAVLLHGAVRSDLRQQELPLDRASAIIAGHTRLQLAFHDDVLTLQPSRRVTLFAAPGQRLPEQVAWQWQQRALWFGEDGRGLWAGVSCCLLLATAVLIRRLAAPGRNDMRRRALDAALAAGACAALLLCGAAALWLQRAGTAPPAACSLLLGAGALLLWIALPGRITPLTAATVVLLASGLLAQLDLGLGAQESSWLRYYQKSCALLAIGAGLGGMWRVWAGYSRRSLSQRGTEWLLAALAAIALLALAAQVLWGDETGVFDLQPVELGKLALAALTAHCLALRMSWQTAPATLAEHGGRWLRLIAPALLFLSLLGMALVQVDDYSPLILLLVWSTAMLLAYALAARRLRLALALLVLVLLVAAGIGTLHAVAAADQTGGFYADRFQVWLAPARHPHTGQQLLLGAQAIADGGWAGADGMLGLRALGQGPGAAIRIPAVQDDFAPAFFLNRHGLAAGLLLWAAQALLIVAMLSVAARAYGAATQSRDFRQAWLGRLRYFALCGGAAFVLGHFLLSWGTNLAIFPIMGQPMSFLSAGGSHLLFFLCPLLTLCAISAQSLEENESCRSMSNTKF
ncbi:FtsW/RodA/SpoVE family cell cycle protein [Oxalobacteraceae bacterium]|nr:FtsW/RodA/SpoVE family cell cycle protein [Oxalobacteraceae bacterium]